MKQIHISEPGFSIFDFGGIARDNMCDFIQSKTGEDFQFSNYQKMFGLDFEDSEHKNAINFHVF